VNGRCANAKGWFEKEGAPKKVFKVRPAAAAYLAATTGSDVRHSLAIVEETKDTYVVVSLTDPNVAVSKEDFTVRPVPLPEVMHSSRAQPGVESSS
jgi:hypothetical protein